MSTHTPLRDLQHTADEWARKLKAWERGDVAADESGRIAKWRERPSVEFVVLFDDKGLTFGMEWAAIADQSEAQLAFFILRSVREYRRQTLN